MTQAQAFEILKTGANVFLTGEPGSGKTHTINAYVSYLREHGIEPAITASTGIAATHIGGSTIHSWSGIGIKKYLTPQDLDAIASSKYLYPRINKAKVLIIDEVSMLSKNILDMVDAVCREVKRDERPFGGLQVVCVGDFFQLPPVSKEGDRIEGEGSFAFESEAWKSFAPIICYLSEQHRQDDPVFLEALSAIRSKSIDQNHRDRLQERIETEDEIPKEIVRLFPHNINVEKINDEELGKIAEDEKLFLMTHKGGDMAVAALKKGCLSPEKLLLKIGAAVMFTKNNRERGYMNGTLGTVMGFEMHTGYPIVRLKSGRKISVEPLDWMIMDDGRVRASIRQMPLRLAWAITIHKSQGMSFDAALMDLSNVFEYGQGYVALSRVRRLSGLFLLGANDKTFEVHPTVFAKDVELRRASNEAKKTFSNLPKDELLKMHDNFLKFCGGSKAKGKIKALKKEKVPTIDITLQFWKEDKSPKEIATSREVTLGTVLDHLDKLVLQNKIPTSDIEKHLPARLKKDLPKIHAAFKKLGAFSLAPVFTHLKGAYSYEDLKFARILFTE